MDKTYIFFDIECANCFNGEGKMCSFGYVVTDAQFTVLESKDIVMNPQAEFDWYLYSPKNRCPLAYSKEYFRRQVPFAQYYKIIKDLLTAPYRKAIGFASPGDVSFIVTACHRSNLPLIEFSAYDLQDILVEGNNGMKKRLEEWAEFYKIDTTDLQSHKSSDDAMMTMIVCEQYCMAHNTDIETLLVKNRGVMLTSLKAEEQLAERKVRRELTARIEQLYAKKNKTPLTNSLNGGLYALGFKIEKQPEKAYELAKKVYDNGGMLCPRLKGSGTLIIPDADYKPDEKHSDSRISVITESQFNAVTGKR